MKALTAAALLLGANANAAGSLPLKACVKWSKEIPAAAAAGAGLFESVARVEGGGPFPDCGVVAETESFGVGWLMRAWMKEGVYSPCGERLGGFKIRYKGEQWQEKVVTGLHDFIVKNPGVLAAAKKCPAVAPPAAVAAPVLPVSVSTAPLMPTLPAAPLVP